MAAWRMAFRCGTNGDEMWPHCRRLGVAIIEYTPVDDIDLSDYPAGEPTSAFEQLWPSQRASLNRLVHDVAVGDVIYVKQGSLIVCKGVVTGPYFFDRENRITDPDGTPWQHQRPVHWDESFRPVRIQIGRQQIMTLVPLNPKDVLRVERAASRQGGAGAAVKLSRGMR